MLVLTRRQEEKLLIDGSIVITVVRIDGGAVRLGIEAPPEVLVQRLTPDGRLEPGQANLAEKRRRITG